MTELLRFLAKCFACCLIYTSFCLIEIAFDMCYSSGGYSGGGWGQTIEDENQPRCAFIEFDTSSLSFDTNPPSLCRNSLTFVPSLLAHYTSSACSCTFKHSSSDDFDI